MYFSGLMTDEQRAVSLMHLAWHFEDELESLLQQREQLTDRVKRTVLSHDIAAMNLKASSIASEAARFFNRCHR